MSMDFRYILYVYIFAYLSIDLEMASPLSFLFTGVTENSFVRPVFPLQVQKYAETYQNEWDKKNFLQGRTNRAEQLGGEYLVWQMSHRILQDFRQCTRLSSEVFE